jgi:hypothetical protein
LFECTHTTGMHAYPAEQELAIRLFETAAGVFAFDGGLLNPDRLRIRPNCLTNGNELLLIDHESALNVYGRGFLVNDPWTDGGLNLLTENATEHLFFRGLRGEQYNISDLVGGLASLSTNRIDAYMQAIPHDWDADWSIRNDVASYLRDLVTNAEGLSAEVGRRLQ